MNKIKTFLSKKENKILISLVFIVFGVKFLFSLFPSFGFDMGTWFGWARRLTQLGFSKFYSDADWTQYTPGYLYWLWIVGKFRWTSELAIKIPTILADIGLGVLIWSLVRRVNQKLAWIVFLLYTLNPVVIFDGSVWGQIDGILTFFLFLSAYFLIEKKNLVLSVFFWAVAFTIKPQALAIAPAYLLILLNRNFKTKQILLAGLVGLGTISLISWPFFPNSSLFGLASWIVKMGKFYSYTSVFAFNIWSWVGFWKPDTVSFLGPTLSTWGVLLLTFFMGFSLFVFRKKINSRAYYYLLFATLSLAFFLFPTKVHERYLFPFFAFLLTAAGLSKSRNLIGVYVLTSVASFLNLYYPYVYYNPNFLKSETLFSFSEIFAKPIGLLFLLVYWALNFWKKVDIRITSFLAQFRKNLRALEKNPKPAAFTKLKTKKHAFTLLTLGVLIFAFISRVIALGSPPNEYFDEVYHAFTARTILHGDAKAWEWWNTPPEGFAYEWTHPPLAKLGMVVGMKIFGENAFGWRIVGAILGVGSVWLVMKIAEFIFKDKLLSILAGTIFALDGLALVLSRIGMNDSYLVFFALLSVYLFLKEKDLGSAFAFGLAISSKWSAIWAIPILGILWLKRENKFKPSLIWFFLLPLAIYLATYLPMFFTGHDIATWWEMQKQMWWYHTNLRATHPYTSPWWSWPFLARPIYLYTSGEMGGIVSRIYAFGNPFVFWFGFASVILGLLYAYFERNKKLGFVIFSYLIFFVPWAASPRIMFLYHYLPSIPFLAIATGYVLRRHPKLILGYLSICLFVYLYFYPHFTGIKIPVWLDSSYYWLSSWR